MLNSDYNIQIMLEAQNNASAELNKVKKDVANITQEVKKSWKWLWDRAKSNEATFKTMAIWWTAVFWWIIAWAKAAYEAWAVQAKAVALVERGMKRVAWTRKTTTDDLIAEATKLQKSSIFWDEEILQKVTNNLLTFSGVGENVFKKTQQSAVDLATTLEWDLQSATIMLGKALENPVEWLWALTRVGITFTQQQKDQIEAMVKAWDTLWAQNAILGEIERMYWGAWKAASDALWPTNQLSKEFWDMAEELWIAIAPALSEVAQAMRPVIESVTKWIMENKPLVAILVEVALWVSWLIAVLWVIWLVIPAVTAWVTALWLAFTAMWWPITILIALLAWLAIYIYKNFDEIKAFWIDKWNSISEFFTGWRTWLSDDTQVAIRTLVAIITLGMSEAILYIYNNWNDVKDFWSEIWEDIWQVANDSWSYVYDTISWRVEKVVGFITDKFAWITNTIESVRNLSANVMSWIKDIWVEWLANIGNMLWIEARANGGPVNWWKTYLVWERWPELFIPNSSGTIRSNEASFAWVGWPSYVFNFWDIVGWWPNIAQEVENAVVRAVKNLSQWVR